MMQVILADDQGHRIGACEVPASTRVIEYKGKHYAEDEETVWVNTVFVPVEVTHVETLEK